MPEFALPYVPQSLTTAFEHDDPNCHGKHHERANLESLQRQIAAIGAGDFAALQAELDPDIHFEIHCPDMFPWIKHARGLQGVLSAIGHNFSVLKDQSTRILTVVAQGDLLNVTLVETGCLKECGTPYEVIGLQQFHFCGGKVVRLTEFLTSKSPMPAAE